MDLEILRWVNANLHGSAFINQLVKYISLLGNGGMVWIALCVVLLFFKKTRTPAIVTGCALLVEWILVNLILKNAINRTRPFVVDPSFMAFYETISFKVPSDPSFPSGHTSAAFTTAFCLLHFFKKKGIVAVVLATLISLSRIFLCVHFPTDVLGAFVIAAIVATIAVCVYERVVRPKLEERKRKKKANNY